MEGERQRPEARTLLIKEVEELTGLRKSSIYYRLDPQSKYFDPTFPKQLSRGGSTGVGWSEAELLTWMAAQKSPVARTAGTAPGRTAGAKVERAKTPRPPSKATLRKAVKEVLMATVKARKVLSHYQFLSAVRERFPGSRVDVPEGLLDEIDRVAYSKLKVLPTLVIQDKPLQPVRRAWYRSTLGVETAGTAGYKHHEALFLASLSPQDPRPLSFSWLKGPGWVVMTPAYAPGRLRSRREPPDPEKAAAEEARYAALLPKR